MSLVDRIQTALETGVDATIWEQTATALLQEKYPWLSPVEAGADIGRDADIYRVLPGNSDSRGRLLATTSNVLSNLKSSHKSWIQEQSRGEFPVDALVIATPNQVSARSRKNVEKYCRDNTLPLPEFYTRDWLIPALVRNPDWRERLTGVKGRIDAIRPVEGSAQESQIVGRESILNEIKAIVHHGGDLLLVGVPGVGKSRLLPELGDGAYIVEPLGTQYLVEDILAFAPKCIAIDDAQFHPQILAELLRIRIQEGLSFSIIAITWPHDESDALAHFSGCKVLAVDLLPRDIMDQIIQDRGVKGIWARRIVLDQAEGRVGWAVMLCESLISEDGEKVVSGHWLLERAMRAIRQVSDSEATVDALAIMAALGGATLDDIETIAASQRKPGAELVSAIMRVAASGLVEFQHERYSLQPVLRKPLIDQWFFSVAARRTWEQVVSLFPERTEDTTRSMLETAISTESGRARNAAWSWAMALPSPDAWTEPTLGMVRIFARLSREAADWSARAAREILSIARAPHRSPWGTESDPLAIAAEGTLRTCAESHFNREAVHGLLDLALTRDPSRPDSEKTPISVFKEMTQLFDPDRGTLFELRSKLLRFAGEWIARLHESAAAWVIYCKVVRYAFTPTVRGSWTDPGKFMTVTLVDGVESADHLGALVDLWPSVSQSLALHLTGLPGGALGHLIGVVEDWFRVGGGHVSGNFDVSAEQKERATVGAWTFLRALVPHLEDNSGAILKVHDAVDLAERWQILAPPDLQLPRLDEDLEAFGARRLHTQSTESWMASQKGLAGRLAEMIPDVGVARFVELQRVSDEFDLRADGQFLAVELAKAVADPGQWVRSAIDQGSHQLTFRMIWELRNSGSSLDPDDLEAGLENPRTRGAVIGAVLDSAVLDDSAQFVIGRLGPTDALSLDRLFARDEADDVLLALLASPVAEVRAAACLAFGVDQDGIGPRLPEDCREAWSSALLDASPAAIRGHSHYRLREILDFVVEAWPDLGALWFEKRIHEEAASTDWRRHHLDEFEDAMSKLPRQQRKELTIAVHAEPRTRWQYLPKLIGTDPDLADELLGAGVLSPDDALSGLSRERDHGAQLLSPVLLKHGVEPEQIARRINGGRSWMGPESAAVEKDIRWFQDLSVRVPELADVCRVALADLERELARVLEEERVEAVRGWA